MDIKQPTGLDAALNAALPVSYRTIDKPVFPNSFACIIASTPIHNCINAARRVLRSPGRMRMSCRFNDKRVIFAVFGLSNPSPTCHLHLPYIIASAAQNLGTTA